MAVIFISFLLIECRTPYSPIFAGTEPDPNNYYDIASNELIFSGSIPIYIDAGYEAYCVLQILRGNTELMVNFWNHRTYQYYKDVMDYFSKYRFSETVLKAGELLRNNFAVDLPPALIQILDNRLKINEDLLFDSLDSTYNGLRGCYFFVELLQNFINETDFNIFYEDHRDFYKILLAEYAQEFDRKNLTAGIASYFGNERTNASIVLEPLHQIGNFGIHLESNSTGTEYDYLYFRIRGFNDNVPYFFDEEGENTVRHEFSHLYLNGLVDDYWDVIEPYGGIVETLDYDLMENQGYGNPPSWKTMVYEHIVRATTVRIATIADPIAGEAALQRERDSGFLFVEGLCEKLEEYEADRVTYPDIDSFFPELITAFDRYLTGT